MSLHRAGEAQQLQYALDYQAKWWLPAPDTFPDQGDGDLRAWAHRLATEFPVGEPWNAAPFLDQLEDLIMLQYGQLNPARSAALWYCPFGLPAAGYVEIFIEPQPAASPSLPEDLLSGMRSDLQVRPERVTTSSLGPGVGYTRILAGVAELGYVFAPADALVRVVARSTDPGVIASMGPELWTVVNSLTVTKPGEETT